MVRILSPPPDPRMPDSDAVISVLTFGRNSKSRVQLVLSLLRFFTLERASRRVLRQKRRYVLLRRPRHRSHENGSNLSDPGVISVGNDQSGLLLLTTFFRMVQWLNW